MMFERFTGDARRVVVDAQPIAREFQHHYIGSEHLLLSLVSGETEAAAVLRGLGLTPLAVRAALGQLAAPRQHPDRDALASLGIDLDRVVERAEAAFGPDALRCAHAPRTRRRWGRRRPRCDTPRSGHIPFSPRAKKCLELSLREALARKDRHIGAEHIALGLLRVDDGGAGRILRALGVSPHEARGCLLRVFRVAG
jgi:ATP-dependent Clp protease ATP-binding subunit ClpA